MEELMHQGNFQVGKKIPVTFCRIAVIKVLISRVQKMQKQFHFVNRTPGKLILNRLIRYSGEFVAIVGIAVICEIYEPVERNSITELR